MSSNEIAHHPPTPFSVVIEIDKAIVGHNIWAAENDAVIATAAMIIVFGINHSGESFSDLRRKHHAQRAHSGSLTVVKL
jgi:hypothetical protein